MKISKLFHWLYGFVMLLPVFAIVSACLISTFNMSAKEESEIIYKYETNEVNNSQDLIVGRAYHININNTTLDTGFTFNSSTSYLELVFYNVNYYEFGSYQPGLDDMLVESYDSNGLLCFVLRCSVDYSYFDIYLTENGSNDYFCCFLLNETLDNYPFVLDGDFIVKSLWNIDFTNTSNFKIGICDNNPIESVETHNVETQDVFYNAVDKVREMPIFSWAYNSFLVAPFQYVLVLFGVPANHVIVELLSYWLAVSIIWLVFDVIMYIPLLVHRWLDKGVLE